MTAQDWDAAYEGDVPDTPVDRHVIEVVGGLSPGTAIDLGCGLGQNSVWLARQGWAVTGLDIAGWATGSARSYAITGVVREEELQSHLPGRPHIVAIGHHHHVFFNRQCTGG